MIRLIASDIDGTLVPDGTNEMNGEIFDVITRLRKEKGIRFVGASGRQYASIRYLFGPVKDEIIYISDSGGLVTHKNELLQAGIIDREIVHELIEDIRSLPGCDVVICGTRHAYASDGNSQMFRWLRDDYHFDIVEQKDLFAYAGDDIVKVSLYHPNNAEGIVKEWFQEKWEKQLQVCCAGIQWMDCLKSGVNKGTALKAIQEKYQISPEETMVFGDNLNDLEMIRDAKYSFAIGNAREEIKEAAAFLADTNVNDGVLKELKKLL